MRSVLTADWVLPVGRPPIRYGAVIVEDGLIAEVGSAAELRTLAADAERRDFGACMIAPGLVNAHTHLALTALSGMVSPNRFEDWLPRLVAGMRAWEPSDFAASARVGADRCLLSGVTVVGDVAYGQESADAMRAAGLGGVVFTEILGIAPLELHDELARKGFQPSGWHAERIRSGISPHAPYTSSPRLLKAAWDTAQTYDVPFMIHIAESSAETELLVEGTGPLAEVASRVMGDFAAPGVAPVTYLDQLSVLDGTTAVHLCQAVPSEIPRMAATLRGAVTCPRSNAFLHNVLPPVHQLVEAALPVGVGTDSAASNHDLDLLTELRVLREAEPSIAAPTLLAMATVMGATALGVEDRFGTIERGMCADLAVFRVATEHEPESALIDQGGHRALEAVMSDGVWRVLEHQLVERDAGAETAARASAIRARSALERAGLSS